jgi:drug/metabolite transporter (DMT)-like permease
MNESLPLRTPADVAVCAAPGVFVVLWASGFIGAKLGLPSAPPLTFLSIRMVAVVSLLALIVLITRPVWPDGRTVLHNTVAGTCVHAMYLGGVFVSIDQGLPAGLSALVVALQPVLTSTLANRFLGEEVRLHQWIGLLLGLAGVYLVVHEKLGSGGTTMLAWVAVTVALIGITVGTLYQKRFGGGTDWRVGFLIQYSAAGVLFGAGAFTFETRAVQWTPEFLFALTWLVLVMSFGAVWLLYFLIRRDAATRVASLFYLTPAVTAVMAWALFGEHLDLLSIVGIAVCAAAVLLVNLRRAEASKTLRARR